MTKFSDKSTGNSVNATEYNNIVRGMLNSIENSGQISDATNTQVSKALANYAAVSTFYTDSGIVNAYILNSINNFEGLSKLINGAEARVRVGNTNTGAATANVNGSGVKNITLPDGTTALTGGEISSTQDTTLRYDLSNDVWVMTLGIEATATSIGNIFLPKQITISSGTDTAHDIDFTAGNFIFSDGGGQAITSALTKQIDATFAVGNNAGGLADALTVANNTTYHIFALSSADGATTDYGFDTSLIAANLLADAAVISAGLTKFKRIASLRTDGSANIRNGTYDFRRDGGYTFNYNTKILDFNVFATGISKTSRTLSIPAGIHVMPLFQFYTDGSGRTLFFSYNENDSTPTQLNGHFTDTPSVASDVFSQFMSNLTQQIDMRSEVNGNMTIYTIGWVDDVLD